jgi:hypothetical protein
MMNARTQRLLGYASLIGAVCFCSPSSARAQDRPVDPDLRTALSYDGEYNGGDPARCSQTMAETYYLKYVEHCTDSGERARVYSQLGALFNTDYQVSRGEKPDYDKARIYFAKALKAEPQRIGLATIRARLGMATPQQSIDERLTIRIHTFKWLSALRAETPRDQLLLDVLGQRPKESDLRALLDLASHVQESAAYNMLADAQGSADPSGSLKQIIRELPGSKPAAAAQKKLNEMQRDKASNKDKK